MAKILSSLLSVNAYPMPQSFVETAAAERGLDVNAEISADALKTKEYSLTKADIYMWLSEAPNVAQGGQNYSFTDEQRKDFREKALTLYMEYAEDGEAPKPKYGYKGSRL